MANLPGIAHVKAAIQRTTGDADGAKRTMETYNTTCPGVGHWTAHTRDKAVQERRSLRMQNAIEFHATSVQRLSSIPDTEWPLAVGDSVLVLTPPDHPTAAWFYAADDVRKPGEFNRLEPFTEAACASLDAAFEANSADEGFVLKPVPNAPYIEYVVNFPHMTQTRKCSTSSLSSQVLCFRR